MNLKSYLSLGAASVAVLASAGVANAAQIAPGIIQFDSFGGGAFFGNNTVDFSGPGSPSVPSPGIDAPIEISSVPFTDGAFSFLAGSFAEISDLPALPFLVEDGVLYDFDDLGVGTLTGFLNDFDNAPGLKFDLERLRRTSDDSGRVQFNIGGEFNGGGFDPTQVEFQFSLITAQLPPGTSNLAALAYFDPSEVGLFPDVTTAPGLNNPDASSGSITGVDCGGDSGVECNTGFTSYSAQIVTEPEAVPESSSVLGILALTGLAGLSRLKARK